MSLYGGMSTCFSPRWNAWPIVKMGTAQKMRKLEVSNTPASWQRRLVRRLGGGEVGDIFRAEPDSAVRNSAMHIARGRQVRQRRWRWRCFRIYREGRGEHRIS